MAAGKDTVDAQAQANRMLKWFECAHLPERLQEVSVVFKDLVWDLDHKLPPGPEKTVAFRKLLEAKDAAVRSVVHPGG